MALLFAYGQSSRGVASPIRDTPRDDLSIRKSNETYFTSESPHGSQCDVALSNAESDSERARARQRGGRLHACTQTVYTPRLCHAVRYRHSATAGGPTHRLTANSCGETEIRAPFDGDSQRRVKRKHQWRSRKSEKYIRGVGEWRFRISGACCKKLYENS